MFKLPDYEVVIHIRQNPFGEQLEKEILSETAAYVLDESTEYHGVKDYHWSFSSWNEAVEAANKLKKYIDNPNLLLLRAKANYDASIKSIAFKDIIRAKSKKAY
jgi:hypothetical protein